MTWDSAKRQESAHGWGRWLVLALVLGNMQGDDIGRDPQEWPIG